MKIFDHNFMLVTKPITSTKYFDFLKICIDSGVNIIQLREKSLEMSELQDLALKVKEVVSQYKIPLIINDFPLVAHSIGADGVHMGQSDGCLHRARALLNNKKIVGLSIENLSQLEKANKIEVINYIGVGSIFPTNSKKDVKSVWGIEGLKKACNISQHPILAIGGINEDNIEEVMKAGVSGVAIISSIHDSSDPATTVKNLKKVIDRYR